MSEFACGKINDIVPYVPGEQPRDRCYIKLNTNENPYYSSERARAYITDRVLKDLRLYSDPGCGPLVRAIAQYYGVEEQNVLVTNGSDEALAFCFQAYAKDGVCFADVTYGFYDVFAHMYDCPAEHIALKDDFTIDPADYFAKGKTIVVAEPNAQTGIAMGADALRSIIENNPRNIVVVDQAYADFSVHNAIPLIKEFKNLVVVNTFSKSRSLAGARVGYVIADAALIADLNKVKYSFHPYNVNTVSMLLAKGAIEDDDYFKSTVAKIKAAREKLARGLKGMGFEVLPSSANFVLARTSAVDGGKLCGRLKSQGILVRHFPGGRIDDYVRITVGTDEEVCKLLETVKKITESAE